MKGVEDFVKRHPNWRYEGGKLIREYSFADFKEAMAFVVKVALVCETEGHHADIEIRYNKVTLRLSTHEAGGKVTEKDLDLAEKLESLVA